MNNEELQSLKREMAPSCAMLNSTQLATVFCVSMYVIKAIKIAGKHYGDSPFIGMFSTVQRIQLWLDRHPDFVASHHIRKKPPQRSKAAEN